MPRDIDQPAATSRPVRGRRLSGLLWVMTFALFIADCLTPLSNFVTRLAGLVLMLALWLGLDRGVRLGLLAFTGLAAAFLIAPSPSKQGSSALRQDFVSGLQRYQGVPYYWGGESFKGIDCSGLVRRGLIDSAFCRGLASFNPRLVRYAIWLWWHDCSASDLGEGYLQMTVRVLAAPSVNHLDHSQIVPGDLAVIAGGVHIMAYEGSNSWIEADPGAKRVIVVPAPCRTNAWFTEPAKIMRWRILEE